MTPIDRLIAIEEIQQLKARYFRTMDTRDYAGLRQVFSRDARFDFSEGFWLTPLGGEPIGPAGPITVGGDAVVAWMQDSMAAFTTVHHGHGHEITIDSPTEAHGVVAFADYIRGPDRRTVLVEGSGHYREKYRFEDGAWRIAELKISRLFNDMPGLEAAAE